MEQKPFLEALVFQEISSDLLHQFVLLETIDIVSKETVESVPMHW